MREKVVGGVPVEDFADMMIDFWTKMRSGAISRKEFGLFLRRQNPFDEDNKWIEAVVDREKEYHAIFFGKEVAGAFNYKPLRVALQQYGQAKVAKWEAWGYEVHYLPLVDMNKDADFPGWKIKPNDWYYRQVEAGKVGYLDKYGNFVPDEKAFKLGGKIVLVDTRCKPSYEDGKQMWESDDLLGKIIARLRKEQKIAPYDGGPSSSRFGISVEKAEPAFCPVFAEKLGLRPAQVCFERAIECNVLSQMLTDKPRVNDGQTNTWVWFADFFGGSDARLHGGSSGSGGLAGVDFLWAGPHWGSNSPRLLAVLLEL